MAQNNKGSVAIIILAGLLLLPPCAFAGLAPGDRAPEFELTDLAGKTISLADITQEDRPAVLSFFGTWCVSCLEEMKDLEVMAKEHNAAVYLVGVDGDKDVLVRFAAKHKIPFPVLWDPKAKTLGKKYDLLRGAFLVVPKTYIISPLGNIEYAAESYDEVRKAALNAKLAALSGKKWDKPSEVAVYFTGSANGYLESCNCFKHPYGGFIKLVSFLEAQKGKYSSRILLDSGDFLPYGVTAAQAEPVFKAMALAGYDAVAVGDQDLAYKGFLGEVKKKNGTFLASNLSFSAGGGPAGLFGGKDGAPGVADKIIEAGKLKVRLVSFADPETFSLYPEEFTAKVSFKDIKEVLKGGKNADYLILLSHAGLDANRKLAEEFGQIDLIIGGHSQELLKRPVKAGNALIVQSGGNLQNVGRIVLRFDSKGKFLDYSHDVFPLTNDLPDSPLITAIMKESKNAEDK